MDKRPKIQHELAFPPEDTGEAPRTDGEGSEPLSGGTSIPTPGVPDIPLMEQICETGEHDRSLGPRRVQRGRAGVDGMTIEQTGERLRTLWPTIRAQLLQGTYQPQPVRRVGDPETGRRGARCSAFPPCWIA